MVVKNAAQSQLVGDHNFCQNPQASTKQSEESQVWYFTTDPDQERANCSVPFCPPLKALDFSLDNDREADENNSYTHAHIKKENLPTSFTICTAFTVEAWANGFINSWIYTLYDDEGEYWLHTDIYATGTYTGFVFKFTDSKFFIGYSDILFYPLQWTRICFSISTDTSSSNSTVRMVADGQKWIEESYLVKNKPVNLDLVLGLIGKRAKGFEGPGKITNLNIFSYALPVEEMILQTSPETGECGLGGDFLNWENSFAENLWNLSSKARWIDLDGGFESPCMANYTINLFPMNESTSLSSCMDHCKKLGGHMPSVRTEKEWKYFLEQLEALSPDVLRLPEYIWVSATEGLDPEADDDSNKLRELDHWPEGVNASEGVWRDYESGEPL